MNIRHWLLVSMCVVTASLSPRVAKAQDTSLVVVEKQRIEITMIPPKLRIRQTRSSMIGFYSWRVDLKTADGMSVVLVSDTVMRTDNIRDIARGSTLRRCTDGKDFSSLRCKTVMTDSVTVHGDELRIVIRDPAMVALVRKERPSTMWGSTFEPNGRFRVDRLTVEYDDADDSLSVRSPNNPSGGEPGAPVSRASENRAAENFALDVLSKRPLQSSSLCLIVCWRFLNAARLKAPAQRNRGSLITPVRALLERVAVGRIFAERRASRVHPLEGL
ncbi:MAG: hypothetical protein ABJB74_04405 [Gemmatimonas sp.]